MAAIKLETYFGGWEIWYESSTAGVPTHSATIGSLCVVAVAGSVAYYINTTGAAAWTAVPNALFWPTSLVLQTAAIALDIGTAAITNMLRFVGTVGSEAIQSAVRFTTTDGVASGTARIVGGLAQVAIADVSSSADAETVIQTYQIPMNTIKAGTTIRVRWQAVVTTGATADTVVCRVRFGGVAGVLLAQTTSGDPGAAGNTASGEVFLTGRAAPGAAASCAHGSRTFNWAAVGADQTINPQGPTLTNLNTANANDLVFTVDWSAATTDVVALRMWDVEIVG